MTINGLTGSELPTYVSSYSHKSFKDPFGRTYVLGDVVHAEGGFLVEATPFILDEPNLCRLITVGLYLFSYTFMNSLKEVTNDQ